MCDVGAVSMYRNDAEFSILAKLVVALAFIPVDAVDLVIESLSEYLPDGLQPLLYCGANSSVKTGCQECSKHSGLCILSRAFHIPTS